MVFNGFVVGDQNGTVEQVTERVYFFVIFLNCLISVSQGLLIEYTGRRLLFWGGYGVMAVSWVFVTVTLNLKVNLLTANTHTDVAMCVKFAYTFFFLRVSSPKLQKKTKNKTNLFSDIFVPLLLRCHADSFSFICTGSGHQSLTFLSLKR